MTTIATSVFYSIGSLVLGALAWVLACSAIVSRKSFRSRLYSFVSFSLCAVSLLFQFFEVSSRAKAGDFAAIGDTIDEVIFASCFLLCVTIILNAVAAVREKKLNG